MNTRIIVIALTLLTAAVAPRLAHAHGTNMQVGVTAGKLTAGPGILDNRGWASTLFADASEDAPMVPFAGNTVVRTTLPGFHVIGMSEGETLNMELLPRRDFTAAGEPLRWLWYWNPATQAVEDVPANGANPRTMRVASTDAASIETFSQSTAPANPVVRVRLLGEGDIGPDQHFLDYRVSHSPTPAPGGVYGFFARLTSPSYLPSAPFFMAFNRSLDGEAFQQGARIINAAARLPGDFDKDDDADGADFLGWQRTFGSTTNLAADWTLNDAVDGNDLPKWRTNFGRVVGAVVPAVGNVPEPATAWAFVAGAAALSVALRRRRSPR